MEEIRRRGLLLETDPRLPSVASLVAGEPIRGSWWAHPRGHAIFMICEELCEHDDVLVVKLLAGKRTYVHRRLWPELLAVARSNQPWQTRTLSEDARRLRQRVQRRGRARTDQVRGFTARAASAAARELEARLLVYGESEHTASGAHAKVLESWAHWTRRRAPALARPPLDEARRRLETAVEDYAGVSPAVPWKG